MKNIFNIVKKELDKIFHSPRLIFSTFIMPALVLFLMYSFMGSSASRQNDLNLTHEYKIGILGDASDALEGYLKNMQYDKENKYKVTIEYKNDLSGDSFYDYASSSIKDEEYDLWIVIDQNFDKVVSKEEKGTANIQLLTHSSNSYSTYIYSIVYSNLTFIQKELDGPSDYAIVPIVKELASDEEQGSTFIAMMAPMLIMVFIFAGALSIGADSIAGEKERGTIATILMAPISKNEIVIGKIISTIIITMVSALCSFIGLIASLAQLSRGINEGLSVTVSLTFASWCQLFVLILIISLIAVSLFLVASTFAKTTKEATMYSMPVYIIGIISGVFTMFETTVSTSIFPYLIPIYNLTLGLKGCFINQLNASSFLVIIGSNIVYFTLILLLVRKMFNSEKIMFAR